VGVFVQVYYMGFHTYVFRGAMINEFADRGWFEKAKNEGAVNWEVRTHVHLRHVVMSVDGFQSHALEGRPLLNS
jgi:hypothetical protein